MKLFSTIMFRKFTASCYFLFIAFVCTIDSVRNEISSSVWCSPEKLCTFQNLCFHPESNQFLFVLSARSILHGLNNSELNQLELSSVHRHNRLFMSIAVVSPVNEMLQSALFKEESLYVLHSFKRDNIMHVLHDDLIPLFSTYLMLCGDNIKSCTDKYRLAFINDQEPGPYEKWYQVFSKDQLLLLASLDDESPVMCYREVRIGLVRSSLWFNYGFSGVQGRLNTKLSGNELRKFRDFVLTAMNLNPDRHASGGCAVFIKRSVNRKILNEEFVKEIVIQAMNKFPHGKNACIIEVDMMKDSSEAILSAVHQSTLLFGMHGAGMALSVFLPTGATILELFPFAINPYNVSPVMAMCDLDGVGLHYAFWRNRNRSLSIPPTTADPLAGGILHLPTDRQIEIRKLENVDAVPCCHDPAYLYYMFQDTFVSSDFSKTLLNVLKLSQEFYVDDFVFDLYEKAKNVWMPPGQVYGIVCNLNEESIQVSWYEPVNSAEFEHLEYEVHAVAGDKIVFAGTVKTTNIKISSIQPDHNLKLWICAKNGAKLKSTDVFHECVLKDE